MSFRDSQDKPPSAVVTGCSGPGAVEWICPQTKQTSALIASSLYTEVSVRRDLRVVAIPIIGKCSRSMTVKEPARKSSDEKLSKCLPHVSFTILPCGDAGPTSPTCTKKCLRLSELYVHCLKGQEKVGASRQNRHPCKIGLHRPNSQGAWVCHVNALPKLRQHAAH
jgi:hypothetical protein